MTPPMPSIFITGAASGIGAQTARRFAQAGWRVGLCDRNRDGLQALVAELGQSASLHVADVRDAAAMADAIASFCGASLGLDVLFNCAGLLDMHPFANADLARLHVLVDVNIKGVINGIHAALPFLERASLSRIITMSSLASAYGVPEEAVYSASKFAVRGLTEALNIEFEAKGIWVADVVVGYVATPMVLAADAQAKSVQIAGVRVQPDEVAETVWQAATSIKQVHWFVTEADARAALALERMPPEERREKMRAVSGF